MFIGHFGLAFAAKKVAPKTSLGETTLAAEFVDLLWPIFLLLGWEHVVIAPNFMRMSPLDFTDYPYTHSLLLIVVWGTVLGAFSYLMRRNLPSSITLFALVVSHWLLDWLVHSPDLLLYPGGARKFGLGLWNYPWLEIPLEVGIFVAGVWIYISCTRARDAIGQYGFWSLIVVLFAGWVSTLLSGVPPSVSKLAWSGVIMSPIILLWAWWVDVHRQPHFTHQS